jgi:phage-related protein
MSVSWTFGGTTLSSFGVLREMDDYMDMPERRGDNITIPFRHGRVHVDKYFDQRKITLGFSVVSNTATAQDTIFDNMRKLFAPGRQQVLACTREDSTVRNANAVVEVPMQVQRINQVFAQIVVEFTLAEPFFRSSVASTDNTTTISTTDTAMVVENIGTIEERDPTILLTGPLTNVTISTTDGVSTTYTGAIASTDTVTIGTLDGEFYATHSISGSVIGNVTHSGSSALLTLQPGTNNLQVTCTATGGTVKISFFPPFL